MTIADRSVWVSTLNSHQTGMINRLTDPIFPHPVIFLQSIGAVNFLLHNTNDPYIPLFKTARNYYNCTWFVNKLVSVSIERTIGLMLDPSTALCRSFLQRCTLTNNVLLTIWRDLFKPPHRRQGPCSCLLWLLFGTHWALEPELAYIMDAAEPIQADITRYFWYTSLSHGMFVNWFFMT